jgi:hypothetical protein
MIVNADSQNAQAALHPRLSAGQGTHQAVLQINDILIFNHQDVSITAHQLLSKIILTFYMVPSHQDLNILLQDMLQDPAINQIASLKAGTRQSHGHTVVGHHTDPIRISTDQL